MNARTQERFSDPFRDGFAEPTRVRASGARKPAPKADQARAEMSRSMTARTGARPAPKRQGRAMALLLFALRRPLGTLVTLAGIGLAGMVTWNALSQQTRPHPAPLFALARPEMPIARAPAGAAPTASSPPTSPSSPPSLPPARPMTIDSLAAAPLPATPVPAAPAPPARPARDPIAELLRTGSPDAAAAAQAPVAGPVAAAQRALSKLGYGPLKADGVAGSGTRAAIESFEKDRKLPVTGELNPRTVREMTAASGIAIE